MRIGVVGCGVFGLAAALELRARGHAVTAFEQGRVPYERAASTDTSKTIRRVYGADAHYVELVERAAPRWRAWQTRVGGDFFQEVGYIYVVRNFRPGTRVYDAWQLLAPTRDEVRLLSLAEARERFPQFGFFDGDTVLHDRWGGYLASARATEAMAALARADGVELREETPVRAVEDAAAGGARVRLDGDAATFDRVVLAAGVWIGRFVPSIGARVRVTRQMMAFFEPPDPAAYRPGPMPVWSIESDVKGWYGHPLKHEGWVKVANDLRGAVVDPDADRGGDEAYVDSARAFVSERIPGLAGARVVGSRSCFYDNTPDHDFVVDWAPGSERVLVAGGGSGHGFKFGGSIGPVIADALEEKENRLGRPFRLGDRFGASR
ncbi:MAG TPA: FAD-dependent oxidoreductase [Chloroflexota bacterium]|jgi:glycine/D-amino acid oxidase-like deaminating enzyme